MAPIYLLLTFFFPFFDSIRVNQDQLDFTVIVKVNDCLNRRYI